MFISNICANEATWSRDLKWNFLTFFIILDKMMWSFIKNLKGMKWKKRKLHFLFIIFLFKRQKMHSLIIPTGAGGTAGASPDLGPLGGVKSWETKQALLMQKTREKRRLEVLGEPCTWSQCETGSGTACLDQDSCYGL